MSKIQRPAFQISIRTIRNMRRPTDLAANLEGEDEEELDEDGKPKKKKLDDEDAADAPSWINGKE